MTTEVTEHHETISGTAAHRQAEKLIEATIDTDGNGDGSITIDFEQESTGFADDLPRNAFDAAPWVTLEDVETDAAASVTNVTADSLDVELSGSSTTNGTVTIRLRARGQVTP